MREGAKRQEREAPRPPPPSPSLRGKPLARFCMAGAICWLAFGDYPSQADDFQHDLAAARLVENSVLANQSGQSGGKRAEEDRENLAKVDKIFQNLISHHPKNAEAHTAYAEYLWEAGEPGGAMAQWQAASVLDPRNAATASRLGGCYLEQGDAEKAVQCFARATSLDPSHPLYHFDLANATFIFRHMLPGGAGGAGEEAALENALAEFRRASDLDPFNADYARAYAETFYGLKQPDWREALAAWSRFLELKGPRDFCYENLARVNLKLGRKTDAIADLDKVTRSDFRKVKEHLLKEAEKE